MAREKLGEIELAILDKIRARLEQGQYLFGRFKLSDPRNFPKEAAEEGADAAVYLQMCAIQMEQEMKSPWESKYASEVQRTAGSHDIAMGILGLVGESGEVADLYKKAAYHGHNVTNEDYIDELGDVLWYIQLLCGTMGYTLRQLAERNVEKLRKRYPEGFDPERSKNRPSKEERFPLYPETGSHWDDSSEE